MTLDEHFKITLPENLSPSRVPAFISKHDPMIADLQREVQSIHRVLQEIEAFTSTETKTSIPDPQFVESLEDLIQLVPRNEAPTPIVDPTPKLEAHVKRLIRAMPPSYCNLFIKTEDKLHYFAVVENEFGIFAVFLPCEKAKSICITSLKENLLEL